MSTVRNLFVCMFLLLSSAVWAQGRQPILPNQNTRRLTLPPAQQPSQVENQAGQNELELPRAVPQFVGKWGGHLYLLSTSGAFGAAESSPESFTFGQRSDGTVYIETSVWGKNGSHIVSARAKVFSPTKIEIRLEHLATEGTETRTVIQRESILLKNAKIMDCIESDQVFGEAEIDPSSGFEQPMYSAIYHGSLRQISDSESEVLEDELIRRGSVPQLRVEGSSRFGP